VRYCLGTGRGSRRRLGTRDRDHMSLELSFGRQTRCGRSHRIRAWRLQTKLARCGLWRVFGALGRRRTDAGPATTSVERAAKRHVFDAGGLVVRECIANVDVRLRLASECMINSQNSEGTKHTLHGSHHGARPDSRCNGSVLPSAFRAARVSEQGWQSRARCSPVFARFRRSVDGGPLWVRA
jgi:hypothetical protein